MPAPGAFENSIEAGPSGAVSPASTKKKKPQLKPAPEKNVAEPAPQIPVGPSSQITTTAASTFTPGGVLLEPQPTTTITSGTPQTAERPTEESTDKPGGSGTYKSPFASEPSQLPSSVLLAGPNYPPTTQN